MSLSFQPGDCVKTPDGRIGRVREVSGPRYKVRVQRETSKTHQFVELSGEELERVECPKGWMSPEGYVGYLEATLVKMRQREAGKKPRTKRKPSAGRE